MFTKGMAAQGRMLANVIKYIISKLDNTSSDVLRDSLEHLARVHNQRGVSADHYSVMGMCLIHTVRICTGGDFFSEFHRAAWIQIYSKMMSIIIPVVVDGAIPSLEDLDRSEQFGARSGYGAAAKEAKAAAEAEQRERAKERAERKAAKAAAAGGGGLPPSGRQSSVLVRRASPGPGKPTAVKCPASGMMGTKCPASAGSGAGAGTGAGGVVDFEDAAHAEVSASLQSHFQDNAASHMQLLRDEHNHNVAAMRQNRSEGGNGRASGNAALSVPPPATTPAEKYRQLKAALSVAQAVELQLREQHAEAISGFALVHLLVTNSFVPNRAHALHTAQTMLHLQLITPWGVSAAAAAAHSVPPNGSPNSSSLLLLHRGGSTVTSVDEPIMGNRAGSAVSTTVQMPRSPSPSPPAAAAAAAVAAIQHFQADEHTLYSFGSYAASAGGAVNGGGDAVGGSIDDSRSSSSSNSEEGSSATPKCYVNPMAPQLIMHALDDLHQQQQQGESTLISPTGDSRTH